MTYDAEMRDAMYRFWDLAERGLRWTPFGEAAARRLSFLVALDELVQRWKESFGECEENHTTRTETVRKRNVRRGDRHANGPIEFARTERNWQWAYTTETYLQARLNLKLQ